MLQPLPCIINRRFHSSLASKPLRILFCGSDNASSAALHAVCNEQKRDPSSIASIDVLCRPGKPYGRGLKQIREVPLKATAQKLGLRIHTRDTFTGWMPPQADGESINLIVAVSFGLFVPPRVLAGTEYGGLNIHPSLLPDLRGPSPVHYAVLNGYTRTGITLQSLSPKTFDHGKILLQTPISIPNPDIITHSELQDLMIPISSDLLVRGLREKVYLPGYPGIQPAPTDKPLIHAPKVKTEDMRMLPSMTADEIVRIERALSKVWTVVKLGDGKEKRVVLHGLEIVPMPAEMSEFYDTHEDTRQIFKPLTFMGGDYENRKTVTVPMMKGPDGHSIIIPTKGVNALMIRNTTIDGGKKKNAAAALYGKDLEKKGDGGRSDSLGEQIYWDAFGSMWETMARH